MAGSGPPPKHPDERRRRNAAVQMLKLPAQGRQGPTPRWPMPLAKGATGVETRELRKLEAALWKELWSTPQAAAWERLRYTREVAQYVRWKVRGELGNLDAAKEARQLADRLGLHPLAMLRLRWEIAADELAARRETRTGTTATRVKAVDPRAVAGT